MQNTMRNLSKLSEPQQTAVRLLYVEGLLLREIADRLGVSKETVYQRVVEGTAQLKTCDKAGGLLPI